MIENTAMNKLSRSDLMSLEAYSEARPEFRAQIMAHKKPRKIHIGPHATLYFEDRLTIQYQIQEMLRVERIFEAAGINEELDAYNPLIPDGSNWKATFMLEYEDADERAVALANMIGIEDLTWVQVDGFDKVFAIADEDLERDDGTKTSSVHFMRFELSADMATAAKSGAAISAGIDHKAYQHEVSPVDKATRDALTADLS